MMADQPETIASEAKKIHQGLKELLKSKEPFDKETEFQRKNLRKKYLALLLIHPYAREAKDAETHLWMQTSYAFISVYKQRIAVLDRQVQSNQQQQQAAKNNSHGPVEHRKLVQRFRQFLAEEEKFWTQFLVRFSRSFALEEAQPALVTLGILSTGADGKIIEHADTSLDRGRNHFQFPTETPTNVVPMSTAERQSRMAILSKALICLGDIARYREQYNESGGRSKVGHDDVPARRGRNRRGGSIDNIPRPRNFDKSKQCYEQARFLVPNEGNPSHQLAIIANYQNDPFASLVHYYRALCVRQPYDTASENMGTLMTKTLEHWKKKDHNRKDDLAMVPKIRIEALKEKEVVIHALWRIGSDKLDSKARKLSNTVYNEFYALVSDRQLPEDLIIDFIVLSQSALWKQRMVRESAVVAHPNASDSPPALIETRMLAHLLALHKCLLETGIDQLKEPPPADAIENDLAQSITAVFRRTLPALRIASKWLIANYSYLMAHAAADLNNDEGITAFWETFADFARALSRAFPVQKLPSMAGPLDEDIEMRGFLPLQNMMEEDQAVSPKQDQVHPNVLQLMRISDLLNDSTALVQMENSPLAIYGNRFMLKGIESISAGSDRRIGEADRLRSIRAQRTAHVDEDQLTDLTSPTEDDPVRDAFRHLDSLQKETEDEDDEIVYLRSPASSPVIGPRQSPQQRPISPSKPTIAPISPPKAPVKAASLIAPTTAQDLLNDVMGINRSLNSGQLSRSLNAGGSPLLFSSGPRQSIWSAAQDEEGLRFSTGVGQSIGHHAPIAETSVSSLGIPYAGQLSSQPVTGMHNRAFSSHLPMPDRGSDGYIPSSLPHAFPMEQNFVPQGGGMYPQGPSDGFHVRHLSFHDPRSIFTPQMWRADG